MTSTTNKSQKSSHTKFRRVRESVQFVFPLIWHANRRQCMVAIISTLAAAQLAPLLVIVMAYAVSEIQASLASGEPHVAVLDRWLAASVTVGLLITAAGGLKQYARRQLADVIRLQINQRVLRHAATLDLRCLEDAETQNVLRRASNDPGHKVMGAAMGLIDTSASALQVIGFLGVLLWIEPLWSGLLALSGVPALMSQWFLSRRTYESVREQTTALRWGTYYSNCLTDHHVVPALRMMRLVSFMLDRFQQTVTTTLEASHRLHRSQTMMRFISTGLTFTAVALVLSIVGRATLSGAVTLGAFIAYWTAAWRLQASMTRLTDSLSAVFDAHFDVINIHEFLELKPSLSPTSGFCGTVSGLIEFDRVTFQYPGAKRPAVDDVSLTIRPGEIVALVGPNGAGKTTLLKLLTRLYNPTNGVIRVSETDLQQWDLDAFYRQVTMVTQTPIHFEATAHENVAFGSPERLLNDHQAVRNICEKTELDNVIRKLPKGYDTHLGRLFGETDLSGGQWRRLAVTQAIAGDPSLMILDEPYANLDPQAEEKMYETIEHLLKGRTAILISHRFSTLRIANRIIVMDAGRIAEEGTHAALIEQNGLYASMYRASLARFDLSVAQNCGVNSGQTDLKAA